MFGIQIATEGRITDFSAANKYWLRFGTLSSIIGYGSRKPTSPSTMRWLPNSVKLRRRSERGHQRYGRRHHDLAAAAASGLGHRGGHLRISHGSDHFHRPGLQRQQVVVGCGCLTGQPHHLQFLLVALLERPDAPGVSHGGLYREDRDVPGWQADPDVSCGWRK